MSGPLKMSRQMTFEDVEEYTSSPESGCGITPCNSPDGTNLDPSGLAPAPVNLSARQAKERGLLTSGTCGRRPSTSSASADLAFALANKLLPTTGSLGSTLFNLTWKVWATPSGRSLPLLRASARHTGDTESIGSPETSWPLETASLGDKAIRTEEGALREAARNHGPDLAAVVMLVSATPTPMAGSPATEEYNEAGNTDNSRKTVALVGSAKPTPCCSDAKNVLYSNGNRGEGKEYVPNLRLAGQVLTVTPVPSPWVSPAASNNGDTIETWTARHNRQPYRTTGGALGMSLNVQTQMVLPTAVPWATPCSRDHKDGACDLTANPMNGLLGRQVLLTGSGPIPSGSPVPTAKRGQLNAAFSRWLMGLPKEWCEAAIRAHRSMPKKRRKHAPCGSKATATPSSVGKPPNSSKPSSKSKPKKAKKSPPPEQ